jgi:putative acetyltransferase
LSVGHFRSFDCVVAIIDDLRSPIRKYSRIDMSYLMQIAIEDPSQSDVLPLLLHGEEESARLYPPESNHHLPLEALCEHNVVFHVARAPQGRAVGTGALVLHGDWAEVKRVWVEPDVRGQGLSKAIMRALELAARQRGIRWLRLETGVISHAALTLYRNDGYTVCPPFADYVDDPLSVFMEKAL